MRKQNQHFKRQLFGINLLWHINLNVYIWKTKFTSHKQYLFGFLAFRNTKKTPTDQIILPVFFTLSQNKRLINLESNNYKKRFPKCLYYWSRFMVKPETSDIRMAYEYIQVTYELHTSTYERHTSTYEWHTGDIRVHTSDMRVIKGYIRVTYGWHMNERSVMGSLSPVSFHGKLPYY